MLLFVCLAKGLRFVSCSLDGSCSSSPDKVHGGLALRQGNEELPVIGFASFLDNYMIAFEVLLWDCMTRIDEGCGNDSDVLRKVVL